MQRTRGNSLWLTEVIYILFTHSITYFTVLIGCGSLSWIPRGRFSFPNEYLERIDTSWSVNQSTFKLFDVILPERSITTISPSHSSAGSTFGFPLTHWGRDKMAVISQTILSNAFYWMKIFEFRLKFHWSLFLRVQSTIFQHWLK